MANQAPEIGSSIRLLMRRCLRVGLGTLEPGGGPYVSLAMVALDHDATPLLYLSDLADHTKNLKRDPRVSLLFDGTLDSAVPLAGERATVQGRIERHDRSAAARALCGAPSRRRRLCRLSRLQPLSGLRRAGASRRRLRPHPLGRWRRGAPGPDRHWRSARPRSRRGRPHERRSCRRRPALCQPPPFARRR